MPSLLADEVLACCCRRHIRCAILWRLSLTLPTNSHAVASNCLFVFGCQHVLRRYWILDGAPNAGDRRARDSDRPQPRQGTEVRFLRAPCVRVAPILRDQMRAAPVLFGSNTLPAAVDRAVERFNNDIPGAQAEYMRMDLSDFGYTFTGISVQTTAHVLLLESGETAPSRTCTTDLKK